MSRVYDALQQCVPGGAFEIASPDTEKPGGLFPEQFDNRWDIESVAQLNANFSGHDRLPTLFSAYSFASEQFRLLTTRLNQLRETRALKSLLLTSSVPEEGKTLLCLNMAISLSRGGREKVLVIDADFRRPSLCKLLHVSGLQGIRDWYGSNRPVIDYIRRVTRINIWVLPAGTANVDPLELINSSRMSDLLSGVSSAFDWVLVDSSPLLPMADSGILSRLTDGTVVVVRRNKTPKAALTEALERVAPFKTIGLLLNEFATTRHYGYERYGAKEPVVALEQSA